VVSLACRLVRVARRLRGGLVAHVAVPTLLAELSVVWESIKELSMRRLGGKSSVVAD